MGDPKEARPVSDKVFSTVIGRLGTLSADEIKTKVEEGEWPFTVSEEQMRAEKAALEKTGQ